MARPKRSNAGKGPDRLIAASPGSAPSSKTKCPVVASAAVSDPKCSVSATDSAADSAVLENSSSVARSKPKRKQKSNSDSGSLSSNNKRSAFAADSSVTDDSVGNTQNKKKAKSVDPPSEPAAVAVDANANPEVKSKPPEGGVNKKTATVTESADESIAKHLLAEETVGKFVLAERFTERPGHRFPVHHYKWENAKGYAQLKKFGSLFDVIGDGNCGYYAFMVSFIWIVLLHPDCRAINSNFCCALKLKQGGSDLVDELNGMLPKEAWPGKEDTEESLLKKSEECMWYDEEWRSRVTDEPINGLLGNRQAYRRTMSVAHGMCPVPLTDPQSEDEMNRGVSSLYCYTCRESPVEMITCRPGTNGYFKAVLIIWRACWPRLRRVSRRSPFNAWQVMVYHPKLDKKINWHRDNYTVDTVKRMSNGEMPLREGAGWGGLRNSQQLGSDVVVFSYGNCPMRMCFKVMNSQGGSSQKSDDYEVEPTFTFELLGGYISILDGVSDAIMMHRLTFQGLKLEGGETKTVRAALVMRRLTNLQEFYADTSTLRVPKEVIIKGRARVTSRRPRSIWS